ncbi:hypothetical protein [Dysgonomonas sp. 511]|uniref:hypothetical protein n=1 Tax=Dysgonomonas sp. 511 TaxID=2302930 RepID=UPI0013D870CD|nr:hypothetical protein [Dysgonomonas sp. 511]NDV79763.1 hypothetical protein [Dysgonomonas sp. 511]
MTCKLLQNIKHGCQYTPGGIRSLFLLDIDDFVSYVFRSDGLYSEGYAEKIVALSQYTEISTVDESNFTENYDNGIYKQQLTTFVRSLDGDKLSALLTARSHKYLVTFATMQGRVFSFGSDGGASLSFNQQSGQTGDTSGYSISITKNSLLPLIEVSKDTKSFAPQWILDNGVWNDGGLWTYDGVWKTI